MKNNKKIYWVVAGLFSAYMLLSAFNFLFRTEEIALLFNDLGYPFFLVIPLGVAKVLGVIAILSRMSKQLKELAYGGFFFDFMLAIGSHIIAEDGMFMMPIIALLLLVASYYLDKKVFEDY